MRRGVLILALAFGLSASAWAQDYDDPYYPEAARDQGVGGRVLLECVVGEAGRLTCQVTEETPAYWEFGNAAIAYSRQWRIAPQTHTGEPTAGGRLRRLLIFEPGPPARILHGPPPRS